jgi:hypothetical protein
MSTEEQLARLILAFDSNFNMELRAKIEVAVNFTKIIL